jgi:hypothetical protein
LLGWVHAYVCMSLSLSRPLSLSLSSGRIAGVSTCICLYVFVYVCMLLLVALLGWVHAYVCVFVTFLCSWTVAGLCQHTHACIQTNHTYKQIIHTNIHIQVASTVAGLCQLTQTKLVQYTTDPTSWLTWLKTDAFLGGFVCACMYVCMYDATSRPTWLKTDAFLGRFVCACMYVCMYVWRYFTAHMAENRCLPRWVCVCMYVWPFCMAEKRCGELVCICARVCLNVWMFDFRASMVLCIVDCTYIHTHTSIQTHLFSRCCANNSIHISRVVICRTKNIHTYIYICTFIFQVLCQQFYSYIPCGHMSHKEYTYIHTYIYAHLFSRCCANNSIHISRVVICRTKNAWIQQNRWIFICQCCVRARWWHKLAHVTIDGECQFAWICKE